MADRPEYPDTVRARVNVGGTPMTMEMPLNQYGADRCPECGRPLAEMNPEAHAVEHWGPVEPERDLEHFLARSRRAVVLGHQLPES